MEKRHYDVGVLGVWFGANYGSLINGYAIYKVLKSLGYSVLMVNKPNVPSNDWEIVNKHCSAFISKFYNDEEISEIYTYDKIHQLNDLCDTFLIGSDQIWHYNLIKGFNNTFLLNFANDDKKKISFGTSFGHKNNTVPPELIPEVTELFQRFNAISVREQSSADILRDVYKVKSTVTAEPVFCLEKEDYQRISDNSDFEINEPYILSYILDPTPKIIEAIEYYSQITGMRSINILDGNPFHNKKMREIFTLPDTPVEPGAEDLVKLCMNASFIITDSFHGTCFSIIFEKPFLAIANYKRGVARFTDLLSKHGLLDRLAMDKENIPHDEKYLSPVDYTKIREEIANERKASIDWLKNAIETPKDKLPSIIIPKADVPQMKDAHVDIKRCQMVAALLRDYGIRHVVISSGTRHIELVRFFEHNDCFVTHRVVDERSAGFFALGLAAKIRKPVALCCTSGTAASNYLSSMTEAYYQHIPLIYITTDRYPRFLNQREDQMIPQDRMYGSVCLKSVTISPQDSVGMANAARRMICETILEATHNQPGPVHINLPIIHFNRNPLPDSFYKLDNVHLYKIRRYKVTPDRSAWQSVLDRLKQSQRILIVYGQNHSLSADDKKAFEEFCEKFNCVICTDNISNLSGDHVVNVYNIVKSANLTSDIRKILDPDIVITMYGASVSEIRTLISKSPKAIHWDISPSGAAADPYNKLTRIFECTPLQFIKRLNYMAGRSKADDTYYQLWKRYEKSEKLPDNYSQKYAVRRLIDLIPNGSLLHLANSNTIRMACSCTIPDGVEVYCNRGTNGIDGSCSAFMGQAAVSGEPCYLLIGDLSFFYDLNSLWNKDLKGNIRIMLFNNDGAGLLKHLQSDAITHSHHDVAEGWVKSLGFTYLSSRNMEEFEANIDRFVSDEDTPMFFEVFC